MKWKHDLIKDIRHHDDRDNADYLNSHPLGYGFGSLEITDCNRNALLERFLSVRDHCKAILEIGVGRNEEGSFAHVYFKHKKDETIYIGIDVEDKSYLNNPSKNIHTIWGDSSKIEENIQKFKELGVTEFDFIFIDGWHSINQVLIDWEYTKLLSDRGIVGFHDTSCHPGPYNFIKNLNPNLWIIEENVCPNDWGIGFVRKNIEDSFLVNVNEEIVENPNFVWNENTIKEPSELTLDSKLDGFPKSYYISLEESSDRRENLEKSFLHYGVDNLVPIISKRFSESNDNAYGDKIHILDGGTIGCVVSHLKMIKKWYEEEHGSYAFFCEDDLSLETVDHWNFTWRNFVKNLPDDWECVQLCCIRSSHEDEISLKERSMNDWSVTAYIMKRDYARRVIERYCRNDGYDLTIPGTDFYPMPETVLFYNIGKVYAVDLFVESSQFQSTFVKEVDIHDGIKEYHGESYNFVSNWWIKNGDRTTLEKLLGVKPSEELTEIEIFLRDFSLDTENAYANFNMGLWYEKQGHTAPALSYFLRSAERSEDDDFTYESLLKCHHCYDRQGTRDNTAVSILQQALCLMPKRPEAYFLLARFHERRSQWNDCYKYASLALSICDFDCQPLKSDIEYPGYFGLVFEKAVSSWWWGKNDECRELLLTLLNDYDLDDGHYQAVVNNLKLFNIDAEEVKKK